MSPEDNVAKTLAANSSFWAVVQILEFSPALTYHWLISPKQL